MLDTIDSTAFNFEQGQRARKRQALRDAIKRDAKLHRDLLKQQSEGAL